MKNKRPSQRSQERKKQYLSDLRKLKATGLYNPSSNELTSYRKRRINDAIYKHSRELNTDKYFFIKAPPKAVADARKLKFNTTPKGIFLEKSNFETAKLTKQPRKRATYGAPVEYDILIERRIKKGKNQGKIQDKLIPLVSLDELSLEDKRIRKLADAFGPLRKNQYLAYIVTSYGHEGYSYNQYENIDLLIQDFHNRYDPRLDFVTLYRQLEIERTTVKQWRERAKSHRPKRVHRRARNARNT